MLFLLLIGTMLLLAFLFQGYKVVSSQLPPNRLWLFRGYLFSFLLFILGLSGYNLNYDEAPVIGSGDRYTPFASEQLNTLLLYGSAYSLACWQLWKRGDLLPPLQKVGALVFLLLGLLIHGTVVIQVAGALFLNTGSPYSPGAEALLLLVFPIMSIAFGVKLLNRAIGAESKNAVARTYKSPFLHFLNQLLLRRFSAPCWALILLLPVFLLCTLLLIVLGQDANSLVKVFTDTAT